MHRGFFYGQYAPCSFPQTGGRHNPEVIIRHYYREKSRIPTATRIAIGQYVAAGADQVNIALRAPFDLESLEKFSTLLHLS